MTTAKKTTQTKKHASSQSTALVRRSGLSSIQQLSVFAFVLVVGFAGYALTFGTHAASAKPPVGRYVCDNKGSGYCLNGNSSGGGLATMIKQTSVGKTAQFYYAVDGTVGKTSPFTNGGGNNTKFYGDQVVQVKYTPISGVQLCPDYAVLGKVDLCTDVSYWVINGKHLINVYETNHQKNTPYYLTARSNTNGAAVTLSSANIDTGLEEWLQYSPE